MKRRWFGAPLAAMALLCGLPAIAQVQTVSVTGGQVQGVLAEGITSFKGIPFAAPPVGSLRWREPQPVVPWSGVKQADHFAPPCMQDPKGLERFGLRPEMNEDCLYLNVWTPARSAREHLPVMVWIYGGAFVYGAASASIYDGARLAQHGVVLVSIAYRAGVFGFLADRGLRAESAAHVSGNYGLRDMIAALEWVRANISCFGGDPSRVTIFGQSSGGYAVSILAVSPAAKGLFQRAISESGGAAFAPARLADTSYTVSGLPFRSLAAAEDIGRRFLAGLGAQDIAAARALPADVILKAADSASDFGADGAYIWPVFDGDILPGSGYDLFRSGRFNDTPVLMGTTANEGARVRAEFAATTPAQFEVHVRAAFGQHADAILALYPHATAIQARQASEDLFFRDAGFAWETWNWALLQSQKGHGKAYLYAFDRTSSPGLPSGPVHSADLGYVFGNGGGPLGLGPHFPARPEDTALSSLMQNYWVNFAKTGDPNGPGLPPWPAFSTASQQALYLDTQPHTGPVPNRDKLEALDAFFRSQQEQAQQKQAQRGP